jgi:hypothetical protein
VGRKQLEALIDSVKVRASPERKSVGLGFMLCVVFVNASLTFAGRAM